MKMVINLTIFGGGVCTTGAGIVEEEGAAEGVSLPFEGVVVVIDLGNMDLFSDFSTRRARIDGI